MGPDAHDAMGDEARLVAEMTGQAELGARDRIGARIEAVFDVHLVGRRC